MTNASQRSLLIDEEEVLGRHLAIVSPNSWAEDRLEAGGAEAVMAVVATVGWS